MPMQTYRIQFRAPWPGGPQEFYYWSNVYHALVDSFDEFDLTRDTVLDVSSRMSNHDVRLDRLLITWSDTDVVVQDSGASWPANTLLIGDWPALTNTVLASFYAGGKRVGYKRYRSPIRSADMDDGYLTNSAHAFYQTTVRQLITRGTRFCNTQGVVWETSQVDRLVRMWQIRHGSKRAIRSGLYP